VLVASQQSTIKIIISKTQKQPTRKLHNSQAANKEAPQFTSSQQGSSTIHKQPTRKHLISPADNHEDYYFKNNNRQHKGAP
jgi:hypothetical protein